MIDNRRYQWVVGGIALVMVIAFSVVMYTSNTHHSGPGIAVGSRLPRFVAPLAIGGPDDSANTSPTCNPRRPARGGLNVCDRGAIVLDLFAAGGAPCVRSVDALQAASEQWRRSVQSAAGAPGSGTPREHPPLHEVAGAEPLTFAAVAAGGGQAQIAALVRRHRWSIPVGIDPSGAVGQLYGVTICPLIEIADASGTVRQLLIGGRYEHPAAILSAVEAAFGKPSRAS